MRGLEVMGNVIGALTATLAVQRVVIASPEQRVTAQLFQKRVGKTKQRTLKKKSGSDGNS